MAIECERKFLVNTTEWLVAYPSLYCHQGYLSTDKERTVRVRILGEDAYITIKGALSYGTNREFEYPIPVDDASAMLTTMVLQPTVEKMRYFVKEVDYTWVVDVFLGHNKGLVLAEVELLDISARLNLPSWVGEEVTGDMRYYNSSLVQLPYSQW